MNELMKELKKTLKISRTRDVLRHLKKYAIYADEQLNGALKILELRNEVIYCDGKYNLV